MDRRRLEGVEHGIERLVVDGDELGRVLGDVPVARDDDGEGSPTYRAVSGAAA